MSDSETHRSRQVESQESNLNNSCATILQYVTHWTADCFFRRDWGSFSTDGGVASVSVRCGPLSSPAISRAFRFWCCFFRNPFPKPPLLTTPEFEPYDENITEKGGGPV